MELSNFYLTILLCTPYFTPKHQKYVLFPCLETLVFVEQNKCSQIVNTNTPQKHETQQLYSEGTSRKPPEKETVNYLHRNLTTE